jgi:DMSO/TMAO reductase YedYZ molybdopterin-dependent catalytic subunit
VARHGKSLLLAGALALALLAPHAAESGEAASLSIIAASGVPSALSPQTLAALPAVSLDVTFATGKGPVHARFAGPPLWSVLAKAGVVDPGKPRRQAGQTILVTGQDGYTAALAVGEVSPDFEGKSVILAESMNGQPLGSGHLRLVIPGDRMGGRNVRDVVRIAVSAPAAGQ